ncbi:MAG: hypothetical protein Q8S58_08330, partial [Bosea sp. (in: a-proteobacteria)]|nr:hypothetical protein [Bosea sp. (in: a-proteobacteria)]
MKGLSGDDVAASDQQSSIAFTMKPKDRSQTASGPRIYYLHPGLGGTIETWPELVEHVRKLEFSHLLLAWPFSGSGDLFSTGALSTIQAVETAAVLQGLAHDCERHGLTLWIDLVVDGAAEDSEPVSQLPGCWRRPRRLGLDPRTDLNLKRLEADFDGDDSRERLISYWRRHLQSWCDAGVRGVRCHRAGDVPLAVWQAILTPVRAACGDFEALAWMPEASTAERIAYASAFD